MPCFIFVINHSLGYLSESISNSEIVVESSVKIHSGDSVLGYLDSGYFTMLFTASKDSNGDRVYLNKNLEIGKGVSIDAYEDLKDQILTAPDTIIPIDPERYEEIASLMANSVAINRKGDTEVDREEILNNIKIEHSKAVTAKRVVLHEKRMPFNYLVFGAPGTGKSYHLKEALQEARTEDPSDEKAFGDNDERCERVTFYSGYTYSNFVGSYKPVMKEDVSGSVKITYEFVPGPLARILANSLKDKDHNYLLILEEINRAEAAAAFGDMFQLLDRDNNGESVYTIQTSKELRRFLASSICDGFDRLNPDEKLEIENYYSRIVFPSNMYIWSTMNSADQGVYPLDTAFKRRWTYKYIEINDGVHKAYGVSGKTVCIANVLVNIGSEAEPIYVKWNDVREAINKKLSLLNINEDKLMGPFFLSFEKTCFSDEAEYSCDTENEKLYLYNGADYDNFKDVFKSKVIMYLFDDAGKMKRKEIFQHEKLSEMTYHKICDLIDSDGLDVLNIDSVNKWAPVNAL